MPPRYEQTDPQKKSLLHRHELRAIVDDAALAIGGDLTEGAPDPHPDLRLFRVADDLARHLGALVEFDDGKHIWPGRSELVRLSLDHRVGDDRPETGELVVNDLPVAAAV